MSERDLGAKGQISKIEIISQKEPLGGGMEHGTHWKQINWKLTMFLRKSCCEGNPKLGQN